MFSLLFNNIIILFLFCVIFFYIFYTKPIYTFVLYFFLQYLELIFLSGSRQRVLFTIHILYFVVYFFAYILRGVKKYDFAKTKYSELNLILLCLISEIFYSFLGYLNGYYIIDILINNYKFIEIFIFYLVISTSVNNTRDMKYLIEILLIESMILGIIELITTPRGGIGLLILMNFGSIIFCYNILKANRYWKTVLIISTIIVVFSQARSYMIAFFISHILAYLYFPNDLRKKTIKFIAPFAVIFIIFIIIFNESSRVSILLSRIAGLSEGLDKAGGYRWAEFQVAFSKFLEKPLGRGLGFLEYTYIRGMGEFEWGDYMHIAMGEILLKTGIIGTILYCYIIFKTAYLGREHIRIAKKENNNTLFAFCVGGYAGFIGRIIFFNMSSHNTYGYLFLPIIFSEVYFELYIRERKQTNQHYKVIENI